MSDLIEPVRAVIEKELSRELAACDRLRDFAIGMKEPWGGRPRLGERAGSTSRKARGHCIATRSTACDSRRVAADHYVYALTDYREVDRSIALARALT